MKIRYLIIAVFSGCCPDEDIGFGPRHNYEVPTHVITECDDTQSDTI
jgi:hypothetical protein